MTKQKKKLKVKLVKSPIGRSADQHKTLKGLGLGKVGSTHDLPDNEAIRGMIFKVKHLVSVEEIK
jgi:large subunit ribosomal protein L30